MGALSGCTDGGDSVGALGGCNGKVHWLGHQNVINFINMQVLLLNREWPRRQGGCLI